MIGVHLVLFPLVSLLVAVSALPAQNVPDSELASWVAEGIIRDARKVAVSPGAYLLARGRRADIDIATEATGRLTAAGVYGMVVAASDGVVVLRGEVRDEALRAEAERLAADVPGARAVENLLTLAGGPAAVAAPATPTPRTASGPAQTEAFDFLTDDMLAGQGIVVAAADGVITLTGRVNTHEARTYASLVAERVPRVRAVRNQLGVRPGSVEMDRQMAYEVQLVLDFATLLQAFPNDLRVSVQDGILSLDGRVVYDSQRREALSLAWRAPGVFLVLDNITLDEALTSRPQRTLYFDELNILRYWDGIEHTGKITPHPGKIEPHSGGPGDYAGMPSASY